MFSYLQWTDSWDFSYFLVVTAWSTSAESSPAKSKSFLESNSALVNSWGVYSSWSREDWSMCVTFCGIIELGIKKTLATWKPWSHTRHHHWHPAFLVHIAESISSLHCSMSRLSHLQTQQQCLILAFSSNRGILYVNAKLWAIFIKPYSIHFNNY